MRLIYIAPTVIFAAVALALAVGLTLRPDIVPSALIDKPVPVFSLPGLGTKDGGAGKGDIGIDSRGFSSDDLKGRVSLVNVFASWCIPCRAEHPLLMRLADKERLAIFGLNYKDKPSDARAWIKKLGNPYRRIGVDPKGRVAIDWGVYGVPETFVIGPEGRIRYKHVGPLKARDVDDVILPIIRKLGR